MAVTAHAEMDQGQALEAGLSAYVTKPYSSEALGNCRGSACKPERGGRG